MAKKVFKNRIKKNNGKSFSMAKRKNRSERGYTDEWYKYRYRFIHHNPKCYICLSGDRINVDHIKTHKGDQDIFWDIYNMMPLCHSCHSIITGRFDRHKIQKLDEKIKWVIEQRKINHVTVKVKPVPFKEKK